MGNEISKVDLKYDVIRANNQAIGYSADGEKPSVGFADTTVEKVAYAGGVAMPVWQYKGKIGEAWQNRSWQNVGNAYKQGFHNAGQTLTHPMNYWDLEFVNSKVAKLEGIMSSNTPRLPEGFSGSPEAKELFEKLSKAKNQKEYSKLIRDNQKTYKKLRNILGRTAPQELKKLQNVAKYNEMYGELLKDFKTAQTQVQAGNLPKGQISSLHQRFSNARLAENRFIEAGKKVGKAGMRAKAGAKISKGVKNAMAASKTLRGVSRGVGKAGGWLMVGMSTVTAGLDIYSAVAASPDGEGLRNGLRQAGKSAVRLGCEIGAMAVGQWAGAALGQALIPIPGVGAAIGGFVGSMIGGWIGSKIADKIPYTQKTVAEEITEEQTDAQNKQVCQAIEKGDIETVDKYTAQFKEQAVDAAGNALTDENGNPVYNIAKISDDEKTQKEFEERIKNLDNYVMTEAYKQQEVEQLKQEAEQAKLARQQQMNFGGSLGYGAPSYGTQTYSGFGPAGSSQPQTNTTGFGVNGNGQFGSYTTDYSSWRNPAWQNSLASQYNNGSIYSFNPNNYSPMWMMNNNNIFAPAA